MTMRVTVFLKSILDWICGIPPVENRSSFSSGWIEWSFFGRRLPERPQNDDLYIYYLIFKWSFLLAIMLATLYGVAALSDSTFTLYFFSVRLSGSDFVAYFLHKYVTQVTSIIVFVLVPFYTLKFRYHYNPRTYDLGSWNPNLREVRRSLQATPAKYCVASVISFASLILIMYFFDLPVSTLLITPYHLESSWAFFLVIALLVAILYAAFAPLLLGVVLLFWRNVGRRE